MPLARECFWLWCHAAGSHNTGWGIQMASRISPVEAAFYMKIPNVIMVRYNEERMPPDGQYVVPFRGMRRVVWSLVGGGGTYRSGDIDKVLDVARLLPNMDGVMMDDFFRRDGKEVGVLSLSELQEVRRRLGTAVRPLTLWAVLYDNQRDLPVSGHLALCDKVTFWIWQAESLKRLETNFGQFERLVPEGSRRILGCYMWDYGNKKPMPLSLMEKQCEFGLQMLKERRIEGMIFLASCLCDLDIEAVEWTRLWIDKRGDDCV